jgi:transmembrane sensor
MDSRQIEQRAAAWLAQRDSGDWTQAHERELARWLGEATAHTIAFIRLESVWKQALRIKALGAGVPPRVVPSPEQFQLSPFFDDSAGATEVASQVPRNAHAGVAIATPRPRAGFNSGKVRGLVAAGILIVCTTGYLGWDRMRGPRYSTPIGVTTAVPLSDGSKVILNTDSEIRVAVNERERKVELRQGEAFFDIVPDPKRPFVVSAGDRQIVVLGTQFSVKRDRDDVRVVVTDGKVSLKGAQGEVLLTAGAVAKADNERFAVDHRPLPQAEELLSWRNGYLTFQDTPLADAAAEFNRYNARKIVIRDPEIAAMQMSGKFKPNEFDAFTRLLEDGYPIRAVQNEDRIVLTAK